MNTETSPNPNAPSRDELQRAANYKFVHSNVRQRGFASIVWGIINIVIGMNSMDANSSNVILAVLGALLVLEGAWFVISPTAGGLILDGVMLVIVGGWNILITIVNESGSPGGSGFFAILGIFQIAWGFQSFSKHKHVAQTPDSAPPPEALQQTERVIENVSKMTMTAEPTLLEFTTRAFSGQMTVWKTKLAVAEVVLVACGSDEVIYTTKSNVVITNKGKVMLEKRLKADFKLGDRHFSGFISPEAFERYQRWKEQN